ncbi:hypothetical protein CDAR_605311 [Caerostris darwini]|uniref:Uncharacterized protein n=1 Tax=Caerostris darwini TaxID=1538125 RepID=A0AAV4N9N5_9ARAC|nr:hypothetical protein CDAR_605311 [Caerostris darwini]
MWMNLKTSEQKMSKTLMNPRTKQKMSNPSINQLKKKRIRYFKKQSTDTMADEEEPPPGIPEIRTEVVDEPEDVKAEDVKNIDEPADQTKDVKPVDKPVEKETHQILQEAIYRYHG